MIFTLYTPTYSPLTFLSSTSIYILQPLSSSPLHPSPLLLHVSTTAKPAAVAAAKPVVPALERARQAKAVEDAKALQVTLLTPLGLLYNITPFKPPNLNINSPFVCRKRRTWKRSKNAKMIWLWRKNNNYKLLSNHKAMPTLSNLRPRLTIVVLLPSPQLPVPTNQ